MDIEKGIVNAPIRAVIYGPEGIGKSTFASQWPTPLFVDLEAGTLRLDVTRLRPDTFAAVEGIVARPPKGYQTLVFDTADWLEKLLIAQVCGLHKQQSIEGFGYGRGYVHLAEAWKSFLDGVGRMQAATGMHVVFVAHAMLRKQELPDEAGAFDRYEMKLAKNSPAILKEWSDVVLFLNYKTIVVQPEEGKAKARGSQRVMYATHHACWDAKNRFGLPDEMPLGIASLAPLFATTPKVGPAPSEVDPNALPHLPPKAATATPPAEDKAKTVALTQLGALMAQSAVALPELQAEMARVGIVPPGTNPRQYNAATLARVVAGWSNVAANIVATRAKTTAATK